VRDLGDRAVRSHADANAAADANAHNDAHTDTHANANANANADTDADAHADAYGNADAWRARADACCSPPAGAVLTRLAKADRIGWARDDCRERIAPDSEWRRSIDRRPRD
jgi:type VI secretion system secreted protein VgrG